MDGRVMRLDWLTIKTKYYNNPGGMQGPDGRDWRRAASLASAHVLSARFPALTRLFLGKRNGHAEVRLLKKPRLTK